MSVKIRLQRHGRKKKPFYHIVIADARSPRDGRFIEKIGVYNPMTVPATIDLDRDKAFDWMEKGAQPTDTVRAMLKFKGVMYRRHLMRGVAKGSFNEEKAMEMYQAWIDKKEAKVATRREAAIAERKAWLKAVADGTIAPSVKKEASELGAADAPAAGGDAPAPDAKADAPAGKADAPAADAKKEEAAKADAPKVDAKKEEPKKADAPKADAKKEEPKKADAPKADAKKEEPKKADAPKADAKKEEPKKTEAPKAEAKKEEPKKAEAPKAEAKKEEPKKADAPKAEAKKEEPKKTEAPKAEAKKEEPKKTEAPKAEVKKEEPKKAEAPKVDVKKEAVLGAAGAGVVGSKLGSSEKVTTTERIIGGVDGFDANAVDLTKIEGIGPKMDAALKAGGITSYTVLSFSTPEKLKGILDAAEGNFGMADPTTWPKQAKMAAAGEWKELKKWQDELDGGKA